MVQGVLAPLQFLVFLVSLWLVAAFLITELSILLKTGVLLLIMITGACWEKAVFGRWLFAPAFFWEDVVSMLVIALHAGYVIMLFAGLGSVEQQMVVALTAYGTYLVNAGQFLWKLRQARLTPAAPGADAGWRARVSGAPVSGAHAAGLMEGGR